MRILLSSRLNILREKYYIGRIYHSGLCIGTTTVAFANNIHSCQLKREAAETY